MKCRKKDGSRRRMNDTKSKQRAHNTESQTAPLAETNTRYAYICMSLSHCSTRCFALLCSALMFTRLQVTIYSHIRFNSWILFKCEFHWKINKSEKKNPRATEKRLTWEWGLTLLPVERPIRLCVYCTYIVSVYVKPEHAAQRTISRMCLTATRHGDETTNELRILHRKQRMNKRVYEWSKKKMQRFIGW